MLLNSMILRDFSDEIDEMVEEFQLMYLASEIIEGAFNFFEIKHDTSGPGKPPYDFKCMIKLIFFMAILIK